jgi:cytidine deaminase
MSEYVDKDFKIIVENNGEIIETTIKELLPHGFEF